MMALDSKYRAALPGDLGRRLADLLEELTELVDEVELMDEVEDGAEDEG